MANIADEKSFFERFASLLDYEMKNQELDSIHDTLIYWIGINLFNLDPEDVKDRIIADKHAEGVDAILVSRDDRRIIFVQAKIVENFKKTRDNFPENRIKLTLEGIRFLITGDYKGKITPELENLTDEFHELVRTGDYTIKVLFVTLMQQPISMKYIEEFKKAFPQIEIELFDFRKLYDFYTNKYLISTAPPPGKISIELTTNILGKNSPRKARVFTCRVKELARIYDEYGECKCQCKKHPQWESKMDPPVTYSKRHFFSPFLI